MTDLPLYGLTLLYTVTQILNLLVERTTPRLFWIRAIASGVTLAALAFYFLIASGVRTLFLVDISLFGRANLIRFEIAMLWIAVLGATIAGLHHFTRNYQAIRRKQSRAA